MIKRYLQYSFVILCCLTSACSRHPEQHAQGYIEGRYTYIATPVSGVLEALYVDRGSFVKKGQQLFSLQMQPESDEYDAALENYRASIAARDTVLSNITYAKITFERYKVLVPKRALEQSALDQAQSNYKALLADLDQANANIESTKALLAQAKWTKDQKIVYAPVDGIVFDRFYRLGEYTIANQAILSLLAPRDIKAIFYIPEPDLSRIQLNDEIKIKLDDQTVLGRISFISPVEEYTPPVIYSTETNYKLIYRIEAVFNASDALKLHPGQPVTVLYTPHAR
ncbi:MAG: hypothetical protein A3F12_03475 [Gammaproteobacteria bacterium RIFCSPHIGHO2_12_FULL_38_14]|nr:MAG: hypothetical protein A3F12_03475 [Gammaproteobacteria bacterium RIFCSPHIGHO2_12_FULL_38_14]